MATTLVTGGSGFLGSHLVRALAARGDHLRLLLRRGSSVDHLSDLQFERAGGDVLDRASVREAMTGIDRVFHVAGTTSMRPQDRDRVFELNTTGTRIVLEEARAAQVGRAVHASSVAAIGPARPGGTADEDQPFRAGGMGIAYVNSKHEAEVEALRLAAHGLPVVIVNPSFVLGPHDPNGTSMGLVRRFLLGRIPAYVGGALNIVDVRDVAQGFLLADEKGQSGERYILSGRNFTLDRLFADFARISGREPPVKLPAAPTSFTVGAIARAGLPIPVSPDEVRSAGQWWTYRNTKARRDLGFEPRPHEETMEDAVRWQMGELGDRVRRGRAPQEAALAAIAPLVRLGERVLGP
ncbi:MAG TPA: NAD-dependent epimerase/dehydratase family protein [Solirubrobacterales bacterium]